MADLHAQMIEDRALRDASLALIKADVSHLRSSLQERSIGERVISKVGDSAVDVFEEAVDVADSNRGVLVTLLAAVALWFSRNPLMALFEEQEEEKDINGAQAVHETEKTEE